MRQITFVILAAAVLASSAAAQQTHFPPILSQALETTASANAAYEFDVEYTNGEQRFSAHFDPNSQPRLRLVSPERSELSSTLRNDFDTMSSHMRGISWCAAEQLSHIRDVRLLREDAATLTFSFQPTRESVTNETARRIVTYLRGELTVQKSSPDIIRVRLFAPRPFSPLPFARVDHYTLTWACAPAPNGRHYVVESASEIRALMGGRNVDSRAVRHAHTLASPS